MPIFEVYWKESNFVHHVTLWSKKKRKSRSRCKFKVFTLCRVYGSKTYALPYVQYLVWPNMLKSTP